MKFSKLLLTTLCLLGALSASALAQQVTTEMIGPLSGSFTVNSPNSPCAGQDNITFTGNVHVVASVDTTASTVDYHINLLSVKGTGSLVSKYVASGATDLLDQAFLDRTSAFPFRSAQICTPTALAAPDFHPPERYPLS
jgi:hypothetical protein